MAREEITNIIAKLEQNLHENGFSPSAIYLFGSQSRSDHHANSDIDVMVVLPESLDLRDRRYGLAHLVSYQTDPRIEAWFVSEKEFNEMETPIISTVREKGELIKAA